MGESGLVTVDGVHLASVGAPLPLCLGGTAERRPGSSGWTDSFATGCRRCADALGGLVTINGAVVVDGHRWPAAMLLRCPIPVVAAATGPPRPADAPVDRTERALLEPVSVYASRTPHLAMVGYLAPINGQWWNARADPDITICGLRVDGLGSDGLRICRDCDGWDATDHHWTVHTPVVADGWVKPVAGDDVAVLRADAVTTRRLVAAATLAGDRGRHLLLTALTVNPVTSRVVEHTRWAGCRSTHTSRFGGCVRCRTAVADILDEIVGRWANHLPRRAALALPNGAVLPWGAKDSGVLDPVLVGHTRRVDPTGDVAGPATTVIAGTVDADGNRHLRLAGIDDMGRGLSAVAPPPTPTLCGTSAALPDRPGPVCGRCVEGLDVQVQQTPVRVGRFVSDPDTEGGYGMFGLLGALD